MATRTTRKAEEPKTEVEEQPEASPEQVENNEDKVRSLFEKNEILKGFAGTYLDIASALRSYNERYATKPKIEGGWTQSSLLREAKSKRQEDSNVNSLLEEYERLNDAVVAARKQAVEYMASQLGVELQPEAPKPSEELTEEMKERRNQAVGIGKMMAQMKDTLTDQETKSALESFLSDNPLPRIGSEGTWDASDSGTGTTRRHRVDVRGERNGYEVLPLQQGFTKAVNQITKSKLHNHGKAPKADDFRKVWENAGEKDTQFEHDGIVYILTARPKSS